MMARHHLSPAMRLFAALILTLAAPVAAKDAPPISQFKAGESIAINSDKAYILMRYETNTSTMTPMLMRIPTVEEMAAYESAKQAAYDKDKKKAVPYPKFRFLYEGSPNLYEVKPKKAVHVEGKTMWALAEVPAGDYILYGLGWNGFLQQCFCFGTIGFTARQGEVADIGKIMVAKAWEPSTFKELAGEDNLGPTAVMDYGLFAAALKPSDGKAALPAALAALSPKPAQFRAIGPYIEPNTILANRLAAVPGVLAYDQGRVIDIASGKEAVPKF
jgi:hypothetical protein